MKPFHGSGSLRRCLLLLAVLTSLPMVAAESMSLPKGYVLLQADFEGTNSLQVWSGNPHIEAGFQSRQALALERKPGDSEAAARVQLSLPVEKVRGCTLFGSAWIKAENVSAKPNPWNGVKFMLAIASPSNKAWPQANLDPGSFEWKRVAFTARIPVDASALTLHLGLESVTGKAWFDDVKIVISKPPPVQVAAAAGSRFKGHDLPRLRGAMISPNIDEASLRLLGRDWKANLIRWQLIRTVRPGQSSSPDDYDRWLDGELQKLDAALKHCERYGLYVVLDLHSPPGGKATAGGYVGSDDRLFSDRSCQDKFVEVWRKLATRYKSAKPMWGYDLANEPVEGLVEEGCADWQELAERTAQAIRLIDPQRTLIVEPAGWGGPDGMRDLLPLTVSNVVYSFHMYLPSAFTHQGVFAKSPPRLYPGEIDGMRWDRAHLEAALQPVVDFQQRYNTHIYVGEFSAIRWVPDNSSYRWLKDVIDIFEAHDWDWSYHAFREWSGWSVEHSENRDDNQPATQATDRQKLLCDWFGRNQCPSW
jgi:endoglucanase